MIKEAYVSFAVAKLLKEKGFTIDTDKDYWKIGADGTMYFMCSIGSYTSNPNNKYAFYRPKDSYPCPTQQMAMRWLREVHKIDIVIFHEILERSFYWCRVEKHPHTLYQQDMEYATYEEAVEAAIKYCLENLID